MLNIISAFGETGSGGIELRMYCSPAEYNVPPPAQGASVSQPTPPGPPPGLFPPRPQDPPPPVVSLSQPPVRGMMQAPVASYSLASEYSRAVALKTLFRCNEMARLPKSGGTGEGGPYLRSSGSGSRCTLPHASSFKFSPEMARHTSSLRVPVSTGVKV